MDGVATRTLSGSQSNSVFKTAVPYGVVALTAGAIGLTIALTQVATVAIVAGSILAIMGTAAFYGVVLCAVTHNTPDDFKKNLGKFVVTAAAAACADLIATVAKIVILELIFGKRR